MNFKSHLIFSFFAVNEQKVLLFARSAPKNAIFGAFLTDFPPKTAIFSKKSLQIFKTSGFLKKLKGPGKKTQAFGEKTQAF